MLINDNKEKVLNFLLRKPTENCFFIGDIENFDLNSDFIDVWKFETNNKITSILLRYDTSYLVTTENIKDLEAIAQIINSDPNAQSVSGVEETTDYINDYIKFKSIKRLFLAELTKDSYINSRLEVDVEKATVNDIDELFEFQKSISEFSVKEKHRESFGREIRTDTGNIYYIKKDNKIVSSATISAENSVNGTIMGVATDRNFRNRGYANACVSRICEDMLRNNKNVILFYNNKNAGKLYKKRGFVDVGRWAIGCIK